MPRTNRLQQLQNEWNQMVPTARRLGIARVREWTALPAASWAAEERIAWLRREITSVAPAWRLDPGFASPTVTATSQAALQSAWPGAELDQYTFGVEIECFLPDTISQRAMARLLSDNGILTEVESYGHNTPVGYWKMTTDGSLGDYQRGCEIVSPILQGEQGLATLRKVCQMLVDQGCHVNRRCGFHVHIGASDREVGWFRNLLFLYAHYEETIDALVAPTRRGNINSYTRSTKMLVDQHADGLRSALDLHSLADWYTTNINLNQKRFRKINLQAYWRHGTVEFRHHQGTINPSKAENWVLLCLHMAHAATRGEQVQTEEASDLESMITKLQMNTANHTYFMRRQRELSRLRVTERS